MGREYVEELKNRVLNGGAEITYDEALKLAHEDLDILAASANEIREYFCGDRCDVCSVISVKEGRCTENCRYCAQSRICLLYTSPSPRDGATSRMPSSA